MPQTHPLYQLIADDTAKLGGAGCGRRPSAGQTGPLSLNDAVEAAEHGNAMAFYNTYTVEPVPGTEPRYRVLNIDPEVAGSMPFTSAYTPEPRTWREVCAVWHNERLAAMSMRYFVYRVVPA